MNRYERESLGTRFTAAVLTAAGLLAIGYVFSLMVVYAVDHALPVLGYK